MITISFLLPIMSALIGLGLVSWPEWQRRFSLFGSVLFFVSSIFLLRSVLKEAILIVEVGNWPAPFGITLVADYLSAIMIVVTALIGLSVNIFSMNSRHYSWQGSYYHPFFHFLLTGATGAFLTGDLFNLFVFFEILLISSFVLMTLGFSRAQLRGAVKYVVINLFSSSMFLLAIAWFYGSLGTLNFADMYVVLSEHPDLVLVQAASAVLFVTLGIKSGLFPFFFWLPAAYPTLPLPVGALFAGLNTKVGIYALLRLTGILQEGFPQWLSSSIVVLSILTMFIGVIAAASQVDIRKILSFHVISQVGYIMVGVGLKTPLAVSATILYLIHHMVVKTNLFLVAGVLEHYQGTNDIDKMGGFKASHPFLAVLFMVPALSLAGVPPLSGFWSKLLVLQSGLEARDYFVATFVLVVGFFTLFSMLKVWNEAFSRPKLSERMSVVSRSPVQNGAVGKVALYLPLIILSVWTVAFGLGAEHVVRFSNSAALQILSPDLYVETVLQFMRNGP